MKDDLDTLVFHPGGALGDFVLCWPVLRTLMAAGRRVGVVSASSRARLVAGCLDVVALPDHLPPWSGLWAGNAPVGSLRSGVSLVLAFGERPAGWLEALGELFPHARVLVEAGTLDRVHAADIARRVAGGVGGGVAGGAGLVMHSVARAGHNDTVVMHVGSGGVSKQWALACWVELAERVARGGHRAMLIAGEAEQERWGREERAMFAGSGGVFVGTVDRLAEVLSPAMAYVGADCGPSHLAGQLGVPTLALFGPTLPERWAPVGPWVRVFRSTDGTMGSLGVDGVMGALTGLIAEAQRA